MRTRPLLTTTAVVASLALGVTATGAGASTTPAAGTSATSLTLLDLALAGHTLQVGRVALVGSTLSGASSTATVTPVVADGTAYGEQSVAPGESRTVPAASSPSALAGLLSATSPAFAVASSTSQGPHSSAGAQSLGSLRVLGIDVPLSGTASVASAVGDTGALGTKTVSLDGLALPSIGALLAALGLDLSKLPTATLTALLDRLDLTTTAVTAADTALTTAELTVKTALDAADAALTTALAQAASTTTALRAADAAAAAATATLAAKGADLSAAQGALTTAQGHAADAGAALVAVTTTATAAQSALAARTFTLTSLLSGLATPLTIAQYEGLPSSARSSLDAATPGLATAYSTFAAARTAAAGAQSALTTAQAAAASATQAVSAATTALATAQGASDVAQAALDAAKAAQALAQSALAAALAAVDDARTAVTTALTPVQAEVDALVSAVTGVLDSTPLVSIDRLSVVQTLARATSASSGGQTATVTGGELSGLHVLGTDVLAHVPLVGGSSVDLAGLSGDALAAVQAEIASLTGALSDVLSHVVTLPDLSVPAPQVGLLTKTTSTSVSGGFGRASDTVKALTVTLPALVLPSAVALPSAVTTPVPGGFTSSPVTLGLLDLAESATFRPGTAAPGTTTPGTTTPGTTTPGTSSPGSSTPSGGRNELPHTGLPVGLAVLSFVTVGGALVLRRRSRAL